MFHSESASALSLLTVWSPWGNPGMARGRRKGTLASGIDVGQGINVGPGNFGKKNKI